MNNGVASRAVAIFTKLFTCRAHVQYGNFAKIRTRFESCQNSLSVVAYHLQLPSIYYVHLFTDFTCGEDFTLMNNFTEQLNYNLF